MRVLLVEPPITPYDVGTGVLALPEPLALECIAAPLLPAHETRILDMRVPGERRALQRELSTFKPDVVAAGGCTVAVPSLKRLMAEVKAYNPNVLTVVGGHHATLIPADLLHPAIDVVVLGEGELTLRALVDAADGGHALEDVPGLAIRRDGSLHTTPERPLLDLDTLPLPARGLVERYRQNYFRGRWDSLASMYTSRGCPHRCSFCAMWKVNRGAYRRRSPAKIVEELRGIEADYIDFLDDNSLQDVAWARELCRMIKDAGIRKTYKVYARADTVAHHPDLIREWKEIGLGIALVGFESAGDGNLEKYNKRSSIEINEAAIRVLKENDVEMAAYFVVDPEFTEPDFEGLKAYIDRWELLHPVFTMLTPFPGTDFYEGCKDQLADADYELFDFFHAVLPTQLDKREFYARFVQLYRHAYGFRRRFRYRKQQKAFGVSLKQILMGRRFFAQLAELERTAL